MPETYGIAGVAAPEDSAEDCAAWLRWLDPPGVLAHGNPCFNYPGWRTSKGVDLPVVPTAHLQP